MKTMVDFYYRNAPIGKREVDIPESKECPHCGAESLLFKIQALYRIGPRLYARYICPAHAQTHAFKIRINELSKEEIERLKKT